MRYASLALCLTALASPAAATVDYGWAVLTQTEAGVYNQLNSSTECNGVGSAADICGGVIDSTTKTRAETTNTASDTNSESSSSAFADLSTATVGLTQSATPPYGVANATTELQDTVHFSLPTDTTYEVGVTLLLTGEIITPYAVEQALSVSSLMNGTVLSEGILLQDPRIDPVPTTYLPLSDANIITFAAPNGDWSLYAVEGADPNTLIFQGSILVSPGDLDFQIANFLYSAGNFDGFARPQEGAQINAALSFILPDGVTFTSSSGVLLSGNNNEVPEPATWEMMLLGFLAAGVATRSRVIGCDRAKGMA